MEKGWAPRIEVYEDKQSGLWHWRICDPIVGKVIASSTEGSINREDCLLYLKVMGRLVTAWAVAEELSMTGTETLAVQVSDLPASSLLS